MKPSEETADKLRRVLAYGREEPRRVNMSTWGVVIGPDVKPEDLTRLAEDVDTLRNLRELVEQRPACGTVGCLAGNALIVAGLVIPEPTTGIYWFPGGVANRAAEWLGLSYYDSGRLFIPGYWPAQFGNELRTRQPGTPEYLAVIEERVEHFIATGR